MQIDGHRLELDANVLADASIQVGERLVEEVDGRVANQPASEGHSLTLAAAQRARTPIEQGVDEKNRSHALHSMLDLGARHPTRLEREAQVLEDGSLRVEGVVLEHHRDVSMLGCHAQQRLAVDANVASGWFR